MEEEEIEILKGMDFLEKPTKCVVLKEYPEYLWIIVSFGDNTSDKSSEHRQYCTGINKKAMLCGAKLPILFSFLFSLFTGKSRGGERGEK